MESTAGEKEPWRRLDRAWRTSGFRGHSVEELYQRVEARGLGEVMTEPGALGARAVFFLAPARERDQDHAVAPGPPLIVRHETGRVGGPSVASGSVDGGSNGPKIL